MKIKATLAAVVLGLVGCKSTPEVIEPRPLDTNASYAFNVANQTALTRNDSPLRDFTIGEIEEEKAKLERASGGEASMIFGGLSILTGNLTGVIDVVGGSSAYISNTKHAASNARWIVAIPKNKVVTEREAIKYAQESIRNAQIEVYSKYGEVKEITNGSNSARYLTLTSAGKTVAIGGAFKPTDNVKVLEGKFEGKDSPEFKSEVRHFPI